MEYRSRAQWGASYDANRRPHITLPVHNLFIHHTVTNPSGDPNHDMREIERIDIGRFTYPSYSWVVHPSGVILEGMTTHLSAHTINNNSTSMAISFIGNFENDQPTDSAMKAVRELIPWIVSQGWVVGPINLRGHRDVFATACPGANLYPRIGELLVPVAAPIPEPLPEDEEQMMFLVYPQPPDPTSGVYLVDTVSGFYSPVDNDQQAFVNAGVKKIEPMAQGNWGNFKKSLDKVRVGGA